MMKLISVKDTKTGHVIGILNGMNKFVLEIDGVAVAEGRGVFSAETSATLADGYTVTAKAKATLVYPTIEIKVGDEILVSMQ